MSSLNEFLNFQKEVATTGSTGDSSGKESYFTPTYSDTGPAKKREVYNATHTVTKADDIAQLHKKIARGLANKPLSKYEDDEHDEEDENEEEEEDTVFVSANTARQAFGNEKKRLKASSGIARLGRWQDEHSPAMGVHKAYGEEHRGVDSVNPNHRELIGKKRRILNTSSMGTSGRSMSTIPDHSHATTLKSDSINNPKKTTLVGKDDGRKNTIILSTDSLTELIKWATVELRKEGDMYGLRRLPNEEITRPRRKGDVNIKGRGEKSPTTEVTVSATGASMGTPGLLENNNGTSYPQEEDPSVMVNTRLADKGVIRNKRVVDPTQEGAYLAQPNQAGYNFNAMEKGIASGGIPHMHSTVQPIHGGEKEQHKKYIEGETDLDQQNTQSDVEERVKESHRRNKKDREPGMDGPGIDDAGGVMSEIGNPISQFMMKQGFDYESDALHRGGTEDIENDEPIDDNEDDEYYLDEEVIKKAQNENARLFRERFSKGEIVLDI